MLKLLAEMSPFCGDMEKLETNLNMLFTKLVVRTDCTVVVRHGGIQVEMHLKSKIHIGSFPSEPF